MEIKSVTLSVEGFSDITKRGLFQVSPEVGLKDSRFGGKERKHCSTCNSPNCCGHDAYVNLGFSIFNPLLKSKVIGLARQTCFTCKVIIRDLRNMYCACGTKPNVLGNTSCKVSDNLTEVSDDKATYSISDIIEAIDNSAKIDPYFARYKSIILSFIQIPYRASITMNKSYSLYSRYSSILAKIAKCAGDKRPKVMYSAILEIAKLFQCKANTMSFGQIVKVQNTRSIMSVISGKTGIFRDELLGRSTKGFVRGVMVPSPIGSDPKYVYIPRALAKTVLLPITINIYNWKSIKYQLYTQDFKPVYDVVPGETYYRYLMDDDIVFIDRQPTLSTRSMIALLARLWDNNAIGIHPSICKAIAGDFDGDEINVWIIRSLESIAEAREILFVDKVMRDYWTNYPVLAPTQDPITATYIMTKYPKLIPNLIARDILYKAASIITTHNRDMLSNEIFWCIVPSKIKRINVVNNRAIMDIILDIADKYDGAKARTFVKDLYALANEWLSRYPLTVTYKDCFCPDKVYESVKALHDKDCLAIKATFAEQHIIDEYPSKVREHIINRLSSRVTEISKSFTTSMGLMSDSGSKGSVKSLEQIQTYLGAVHLKESDPTNNIRGCLFPFTDSRDRNIEFMGLRPYSIGCTPLEAYTRKAAARVSIDAKNEGAPVWGYALRDSSKQMDNIIQSQIPGVYVRLTDDPTRPDVVSF